jgi:hypothetical protein
MGERMVPSHVARSKEKYNVKWLLIAHLKKVHRFAIKKGKFGHLLTHLEVPKQQNHVAMNVRVLSDPIVKWAKGCNSYKDHHYNKIGLVAKDYRRPRGDQKTSSGKGFPKTSIANLQDSNLGVC